MNPSNIYDMTNTCEIGNKFYEYLGKGKYRVMAKISEGNEMVKDKKLIAKLDKIFKFKEAQNEEE